MMRTDDDQIIIGRQNDIPPEPRNGDRLSFTAEQQERARHPFAEKLERELRSIEERRNPQGHRQGRRPRDF